MYFLKKFSFLLLLGLSAFGADSPSVQNVKIVGGADYITEQYNVQSTSGGALHVNIRNGSGVELGNTDANPIHTTSVSSQFYLKNSMIFSLTASVNMVTSGLDNPLIYLKNPSTSSKVYYIASINAGTTVTNVQASFKIFANPITTSDGTTETARQRYVGTSPVSGTSRSYSTPTVTTPGGILSNLNHGQNNNSVKFADEFTMALYPGNSLLITGNPSSNGRNAVLSIVWIEESL